MLKTRTKEIIICVITLVVLALVSTDVMGSDLNSLLGNNTNNTNNIQVIQEINNTNNVQSIQEVNNTNTKTNNTTNIKNNSNTNTTMPNTGVDYSIVFIIAICGISAIYAYKKIRDYNNI